MTPAHQPDLSIVVPLYNEEDNVALLHAAVSEALQDQPFGYELVLVDDGSRDATLERACALVGRDARVRVVKFCRNYGQTAAMSAGIRTARGRIIVTMDGDLQNDPSDIPKLVELLEQGNDIVVGWRYKRQDEGLRVWVSKCANRIMAAIMGVAVNDSGCSLKAYRAELIQGLPLYGELHRFIPAMSRLAGGRLVEVRVKHHPRRFGVSKYGFSRIWKVLLDIISIRMLLSYVHRPLMWHGSLLAFLFVTGTALLGAALLLPRDQISVVDATIGLVVLSLGMSLLGWGLIGFLFASVEPGIGRFATIASTLSARLNSEGRKE